MVNMSNAETSPAEFSILNQAIESHASGKVDSEQRSPLDTLLDQIRSTPEREAWGAALAQLVKRSTRWTAKHWRAVEYIVVFADLATPLLLTHVEDQLRNHQIADPVARGSAYALLSHSDRPVAVSELANDFQLKSSMPLLWLDLVLPLLTHNDQRQIILDAVKSRALSVAEMVPRFTELRLAGGSRLGVWLQTLKEALPASERPTFASLVQKLGLSPSRASPHARQRLNLEETVERFRTGLASDSGRYASVMADAA